VKHAAEDERGGEWKRGREIFHSARASAAAATTTAGECELTTRLASRLPLRISVMLVTLFPPPCQRPEGALAGRSRSSRPRAGAETLSSRSELV
jgi:hypothetical protein